MHIQAPAVICKQACVRGNVSLQAPRESSGWRQGKQGAYAATARMLEAGNQQRMKSESCLGYARVPQPNHRRAAKAQREK
jgi:hypothetical protein